MKDFLINTTLFIVAIAAIAGATWYVSPSSQSEDYTEEVGILSEGEILGYSVETDIFGSIVAFSYKGGKLPEKLAENEVVDMRTETSFTKHMGFKNKGTSQEKIILELVSYPQQAFINKDGEWFYIEHGIVPKKVFDKATQENSLSKWLINIAYADYIITNEKHYSASGDGHVYFTSTTSWNNSHDSTTGTAANGGSTGAVYSKSSEGGKAPDAWTILRLFLPFDTSSIKASANITSASLNVYVITKVNQDNDGVDYITVIQTNQGTHTTLANADYNNAGSTNNPTEGVATGQRKDVTSISTSAYLTFTLNSTGIGWINVDGEASECSSSNGISCFGLREGHDTTDSPIVLGPSVTTNSISVYLSEQTGTSNDPYLQVTYEVLNFAPWMFQAF